MVDTPVRHWVNIRDCGFGAGDRCGCTPFQEGGPKVCSNHRGITLLSLHGTVYYGMLEMRVRLLVEPWIQVEYCGFCPGRGTLDPLYILARVLEGAQQFAQPGEGL